MQISWSKAQPQLELSLAQLSPSLLYWFPFLADQPYLSMVNPIQPETGWWWGWGWTIQVVKILIIFISIISNTTLAWKLWTRKNIHSVFNLGMCFFFLWSAAFSPFLVYEYAILAMQMMDNPDQPYPDTCSRLFLFKTLCFQASKVFLVNCIFRYINKLRSVDLILYQNRGSETFRPDKTLNNKLRDWARPSSGQT